MARMIFIFLDGVGIGNDDDNNPFFQARCPFLPFYRSGLHLPDDTPVKPIDCLLGFAGIPQSATGQSTLFTGINMVQKLQKHWGSYPNRLLRQFIANQNLLLDLHKMRIKATFINAYPVYARFFSRPHIELNHLGQLFFSTQFPDQLKRRISTTTCMMVASGITPFNETDIAREKSIYQDFTNHSLIEKGLRVSPFTPLQAAKILSQALDDYDFILYEFFQTDRFGHRGSKTDCLKLVKDLNLLVEELIKLLDRHTDTLIVSSDHGNIEDTTTHAHTQNPVPVLSWGLGHSLIQDTVSSIADITPAIIRYFANQS